MKYLLIVEIKNTVKNELLRNLKRIQKHLSCRTEVIFGFKILSKFLSMKRLKVLKANYIFNRLTNKLTILFD